MSALKSIVEARHEGNVNAPGALKISALSFGSRFGATSPPSSEQIIYNPKSVSILPPKSDVAIASQWEESLSVSLMKRMRHYNLSGNLMYKKLIRDNLEAMINWMQQQEWKEPLNRKTWRLIILDEYVNFEKLYATLDSDYLYETRSISTRNEWEQAFCVWEKAWLPEVFTPGLLGCAPMALGPVIIPYEKDYCGGKIFKGE
ncbi:hypothetical protein BDQ12DRAFT_668661 [Crucibulum laeve]|uniref:Uncharacterized protein n=1 Tax=Crucibulum laeve TaxID=68775 RepID=A0A5C3LRI1_9AGAR|nr:hypothetical protein BDQ12DRAFT_668661 [Crucibulum laeve]